jgi:hypothetical protein
MGGVVEIAMIKQTNPTEKNKMKKNIHPLRLRSSHSWYSRSAVASSSLLILCRCKDTVAECEFER